MTFRGIKGAFLHEVTFSWRGVIFELRWNIPQEKKKGKKERGSADTDKCFDVSAPHFIRMSVKRCRGLKHIVGFWREDALGFLPFASPSANYRGEIRVRIERQISGVSQWLQTVNFSRWSAPERVKHRTEPPKELDMPDILWGSSGLCSPIKSHTGFLLTARPGLHSTDAR